MSANELDENALEPTGNMHDHSILVAADIEDEPIIGDEVYRGSKLQLDPGRDIPVRLPHVSKPSLKWP